MRTDYKSGLLQVSAALHNYYNLQSSCEADPIVRDWLNRNQFRCVVVMLVDAMGTEVMKKHLSQDSFLRRYLAQEVMSVFPPTTTAATTALLTGEYPAKTGWLGWNQYIPKLDDHLILFLGKSYYGNKDYPGFVTEYLPVKWLPDALRDAGIHAETVWPSFGEVNACDTFARECRLTAELAHSCRTRFIYTYWDAFDDLMHLNGVSCDIVGDTLREIDGQIEKMAQDLPDDVGLLVIADHGMTDIECHDLRNDHDLVECFAKAPSLEPRACMFHLKNGTATLFMKRFREKFEDAFELMTKQEILESGLFGPIEPPERVKGMLGDVIAIATTPLSLFYSDKKMKGHHAGGTKEELMIPVVLYPK